MTPSSARQRFGRQVLWHPPPIVASRLSILISFSPSSSLPPPLPSPSASSHPDTDVTDLADSGS